MMPATRLAASLFAAAPAACFVDSGPSIDADTATSTASTTASTTTTTSTSTTSTSTSSSAASSSGEPTTGSTGALQSTGATTGQPSTGPASSSSGGSPGDLDVPDCPVLYFENFAQEPTLTTQGGSWKWDPDAGTYIVHTLAGEASYASVEGQSWQDAAVYTRFRIATGAGWMSLRARADVPVPNYYFASARVAPDTASRLGRMLTGTAVTFAQGPATLDHDTWYVLRFELGPGLLRMSVADAIHEHPDDALVAGSVALGGLDEADIHFDWLLVCALT